jgi:small nuclear ribonucleoprotein (snRNP)-like protein
MDWMEWNGRRIFLRTRNNKVYSGIVVDVDKTDETIIFLTITDKFNNKVTFATSEIVEIKEERE